MASPTYASRADVIVAAGGESRLLEIADHDGDGQEDEFLVDTYICDAEGEANSYIRQKFEVPLIAPIPSAIRTNVAGWAVYMMKSDRDAATEGDELKHERRIKWFELLAKGLVDPGINPAPAASPKNAPRYTDRDTAKKVGRKNLEGFS